MHREYESGDKIEYKLFDEKGKEHWFKGVIHAVRRYEDAKTNMIERVTYLVDTGRDVRVDEHPVNERHREIDRRVNELQKKGKTFEEAVNAVVKHSDLPKDKTVIEKVRQPEQIELPPDYIRSLE